MIILGSASPRRKELLSLLTDDFAVEAADVDEDVQAISPEELVRVLSLKKARAVSEANHLQDTVIGADTIVFVDGEILGKPHGKEDARRMIKMLSGNTHTVYTGVALIKGGYTDVRVANTRVEFDALSKEEIERYVESTDIYDKAGAYAVQGEAAKFISRIEGCFYNVMGLPVNTLYNMLKRAGDI